MQELVGTLARQRSLGDEGLRALLESPDGETVQELHAQAREVAEERFGKKVYLRALIEWSNVCRNDCLYCGIRKSNRSVHRYTLTRGEILSACEKAWTQGLRTFVLQGGENPPAALELAGTVAEIRASWPEAAITLSLGELPYDTYKLLKDSGADRYLLRHETASPEHYARLHPAGMRLESRIRCIRSLKALGFQTGVGMMVGSPFQTPEDLIRDIRFIESVRPQMVGIGPFIPAKDTPFADQPAGSADKTLRLYSILRLMFPNLLIPSTTALSTLLEGGRQAGILAGANVIMPSFTPASRRADYALYEGKSHEELPIIEQELTAIGYGISRSRGDYSDN